MKDRIEKSIELKAPVARVWRALTDYEQFGEWFRVQLHGPFVVGGTSRGHVLYPGYEHLQWEATIETMETEQLFSYRWCPYSEHPDLAEADRPTTLVEFRLEAIANGTRLTITESGFNALPDDQYRIDAMRQNDQGWDEQTRNITAYVES